MTVDLQTQIHDYAEYFGSTLPATDLNSIIAQARPGGDVEAPPLERPRWLVAAAAAAVVLVVIGVAAVVSNLLGGDPDPVIDSPTTTAHQATSTLPPEPPHALASAFRDSNGIPLGEATLADGISSSDPAAATVLEAVTEQLLSDPSFGLGANRQEREQRLLGCAADGPDCTGSVGGLQIHLALDLDLHRAANDVLDTWLGETDGVLGSIVMIDNATGAIRVLVEPTVATQAGSTAKLFPLVAALESGIGLNSSWDITSPLLLQEVDGSEWTVIGGRVEGGQRSLEASTYFSTNVTFAQIGVEVGPEAMAEVADRLGVSTEVPAVYSLALGAGEVTPLDMAAAYSTIANYGERVQPHLVERIDDTDGTVLYQAATTREQVIDRALAAAVVNTLEKVVAQGTGTGADIGRPQAGKTGSTEMFTDAWFVGFTPRFTTAVWLGTPDDRPMTNLSINDLFYSRVFGGSVPAPIWAEFMSIALADVPIAQFDPDPAGTDAYYSTERPIGQ